MIKVIVGENATPVGIENAKNPGKTGISCQGPAKHPSFSGKLPPSRPNCRLKTVDEKAFLSALADQQHSA